MDMTGAPGWPETIIDLTARTITLGAVTRPLTGLDVEAEILPLLAAQATDHGHPVRATFTAAGGWSRRMVVTGDGHLHPLSAGHTTITRTPPRHRRLRPVRGRPARHPVAGIPVTPDGTTGWTSGGGPGGALPSPPVERLRDTR